MQPTLARAAGRAIGQSAAIAAEACLPPIGRPPRTIIRESGHVREALMELVGVAELEVLEELAGGSLVVAAVVPVTAITQQLPYSVS